MLVTMRVLQAGVKMKVALEHIDATDQELEEAQLTATEAWLRLLNETWSDAPEPLTEQIILNKTYCYSTEYLFLARYYARKLSEAPSFAERIGAGLLEHIAPPYARFLPMRHVYGILSRKLRQHELEVRAIGTTWHSTTIQWQARRELECLPEELHSPYLELGAEVLKALFSRAPRALKGFRPALVVEDLSMLKEAPYYQWGLTWERGTTLITWQIAAGLVISAVLVVLAVVGSPSFDWAAWLAFLPAAIGWFWNRQRRLQVVLQEREKQLEQQAHTTELQSSKMEDVSMALKQANEALQRQVEILTNIRNATLSMATSLDQKSLLDNVIDVTTKLLQFDRALVLLMDEEKEALVYGSISHPIHSAEDQFRLEQLAIPQSASEDFRLLTHWLNGRSVLMDDVTRLVTQGYGWPFGLLEMTAFFSVPLKISDDLLGVIIVDNRFTNRQFSEESKGLLEALAANIGIALQNARLYQLTDERLNSHVKELDMMRQVDRELMEALSWERVLNMILDWALRLTGAHGASLAIVDHDKRELRIAASYGMGAAGKDEQVLSLDTGIMGRAARNGKPAIVADVKQDKDYIARSDETRSYMSVPIHRRGRVLAVLNLESPHRDHFRAEHLDFAERLANRASVALDNARLFEETQREREKLSSVMEKTSDIIIVVGFDKRLILLNEAAISTFRLNPREVHAGKLYSEVFAFGPLEKLGHRFLERQPMVPIIEEITVDEARYFHTHISSNEQVGWVIVMHDVTPFKETEQLKNELIATVSHDLKNPLSVINGYIELLGMYNELNERGQEFMVMIRRSIKTMRQLIDDLLELAHIDAGLEITPEEVTLHPLIQESVMGLKSLADEKLITIELHVPEELPPVEGDEKRLRQIIVNLVSNAIKYTPNEGNIKVGATLRDDSVMISVEDTGLGISPEDQAQIFERFYRVRRPETDGIEGTGLGLAIVKSLVEAHGGTIGLKSHLGEGSTFYFTIPLTGAPRNGSSSRESYSLPKAS